MTLVDRSCKDTVWLTPPHLVEASRDALGWIGLDPATEPTNPTKATTFFTERDNGLSRCWTLHGPVFVNPPYGRDLKLWCDKIDQSARAGQQVLALMPCGARFSTKYWQRFMLTERLSCLCFLNKRVSFLRPDGKPAKGNLYDSAVYAYNVDRQRFKKAFSKLGRVIDVLSVTEQP